MEWEALVRKIVARVAEMTKKAMDIKVEDTVLTVRMYMYGSQRCLDPSDYETEEEYRTARTVFEREEAPPPLRIKIETRELAIVSVETVKSEDDGIVCFEDWLVIRIPLRIKPDMADAVYKLGPFTAMVINKIVEEEAQRAVRIVEHVESIYDKVQLILRALEE